LRNVGDRHVEWAVVAVGEDETRRTGVAAVAIVTEDVGPHLLDEAAKAVPGRGHGEMVLALEVAVGRA